MSLDQKLDVVVSRASELEGLLTRVDSLSPADFARLSKEYADLGPLVTAVGEYRRAQAEAADLEMLGADANQDGDMRELAREELAGLKRRLPELLHEIRILLLPKDETDDKNAIIEVRAGTGGEEAGLFAADLFRMYQRYAEAKRWRFELMDLNETGLGGLKEATANISGRGAYARLKYESGVHRVQRVPETEASGRIHTSAATVAVLPEAEDVDVHIDEKDLRIDVYRSSGPGGQSVNTTDSAVRITHLPTGLVVTQQDEKSQHKNKAKALKILRARLYDMERSRLAAERAADRRSQVGSGDRSERIRTYNFPQGRVTDHRINLTLYKLDRVLEGDLDDLIEALIADDQAQRMAESL
jgi:peptide chain release factor 1